MNNNAKYAFYYLLSLVALIFVTINSGIIVFQIINKFIPDTLTNYSDSVSQELLRFTIASLVFATPVFFLMNKFISKGLVKKEISLTDGIRRWLTYLIIFISSVVILVWLIMTMTSFLNGELSMKVALKTLTILGIAGSVFGYYFYDIKKEKVSAKDPIACTFFIASLVLVLAALVSAIMIMDKPATVRDQRHDQTVINDLSMIDSAVNQYYVINKKLPASLDELKSTSGVYLRDENLMDAVSKAPYQYKPGTDNNYQLCADFKLATNSTDKTNYSEPKWDHQTGNQCFDLVVVKQEIPALPVQVK